MPSVADLQEAFSSFKYKFGRSPAIGTSYEVIWSGDDGFDGFKDTAVLADIVSDSADDTYNAGAGAGAWFVEISGLGEDDNGVAHKRISEVVELEGLTPVTTTKKYNLIRRMRILNPSGSPTFVATGDGDMFTGPNHGIITATENGGADVMAHIAATEGQTLFAGDQVPVDEYGKFTGINFYCSAVAAGQFTGKILYQVYGSNAWLVAGTIDISAGGVVNKKFAFPQLLLPRTKIIAVGKMSTGTQPVSCDFEWKSVDVTLES